MNKIIHKNIAEIESFLNTFNPPTLKLDKNFKTKYRAFHSLLIWGFCYEKSDDLSNEEKVYLKETLSDLSHSLFLVLLNLYKPSRFSMRSSIENFMRTLLITQSVEIANIESVYGLFEKANKEFIHSPKIKQRIGRLRAIYSDLCKSAHSVKIDYLSLTIPLEQITDYDEDTFSDVISVFSKTCKLINQLAFLTRPELITLAGHKNGDILKDSIPKELKRIDISQ